MAEGAPQPRAEIEASGALPDGAFIFVNFNSFQKIEPELFDAWCQIVAQARRPSQPFLMNDVSMFSLS